MRQTVRVADAFPVVVIGFSIAAIVVAVVVAISSGGLYERIGRGGLSMDPDEAPPRPAPRRGPAHAGAAAGIRPPVGAKSARRRGPGEAPLDVEHEIAALTRPAPADAELREEVRQLVVARNERRIARGKPPLDVDEEVERQLRDLGA